jgi:peroxiredoxin
MTKFSQMKKLMLVVSLGLIVWACGDKTQFTLNGNIVPASDGAVVMYGFEKGNPVPVDTATLAEGQFSFTGNAEIPELRLFSIEGQNRYIAQLFVEAGKIDMTVYPDSFEANVVSGSSAQEVFDTYMSEVIKFSEDEGKLQQRFRQAQASGNSEEMDAVRFEYETILDNTKLYARNFINEYSYSPVAAYVYLMNFFQEAELEELDSMLNVFEPIKSSDFVVALQDRADALRVSGVGAVAPDFTLTSPDGEEFSLSSLRGKYVLIDFWASWCQPCMVEMPNVIEQYNAYHDKGFEIIGVSLDREREPWLRTIDEMEMNWLHGWDMEGDEPGATANLYGVTGIPHTVLLDKEGKIIAKNLRGAALKNKLSELLD